jgi:hypothetical protein
MLTNVKNTMSNIGENAEDLAKVFGAEAAELVKRFSCVTADLAKTFGVEATDLAKRFGSGTADLAKRIGPKRAVIGVAVLGALVGGSILLVRYLRARKEDLPVETGDEQAQGRSQKRHGKRGAEHYSH